MNASESISTQYVLDLPQLCHTITHAAKLIRVGRKHADRANTLLGTCRNMCTKEKRAANSEGSKGIKNASAAIGDNKAKPLVAIKRGRDTPDGGLAGQTTTDPREVDAIVHRAWKRIYDGMAGCIETNSIGPIPYG